MCLLILIWNCMCPQSLQSIKTDCNVSTCFVFYVVSVVQFLHFMSPVQYLYGILGASLHKKVSFVGEAWALVGTGNAVRLK